MRSVGRQKEIRKRLRVLMPLASMDDFQEVEKIASAGHLRHLPPSIAAWQALTTHIRHNHTDYDALLSEGYDPDSARHFVVDTMNELLETWGSAERISDQET